MGRKGMIIWIVGMVVLGLLSTFLFNQSRNNREELDRQASRNILMMRDALKRSSEDLRIEIKSFITYRMAKNGLLGKSFQIAADSQKRDTLKFSIGIKKMDDKHFEFLDSIKISFLPILDSALLHSKTKDTKEILARIISHAVLDRRDYSDILFFTKVPYLLWLREMAKNNTFFEEILLVSEQGDVLYPESLKGVSFLDSLSSISQRFGHSNVSKFEVFQNSKAYNGYISPIVEGQEKIWILGLKEQEDMEAASFRIDYTLLTFIALFLLLLLVLLPIISYLNMDKGDQLTKHRVSLLGLSLLVFMLALGWTCAYLLYLPFPVEEEKSRAQEVQNAIVRQLDLAKRQLQLYQLPSNDSIRINELLTANPEGYLTSMITKKISSRDNPDLDFKYISIAHRRYFQNFARSPKNDTLFFYERIFSQNDGSPEQIISAKLDSNSVHAVTFKLDALPYAFDRRFLVVKTDGEVFYTSNKFEIPFTHIQKVLPAEKWEEFQTLVDQKNRFQEWVLPLIINGQEFKAILRPLDSGDGSGLWFIYLVNLNLYHIRSGLSALESLGWICFYLLVLSFLYQVTKNSADAKYNWIRYGFRWLSPRKDRKRNFQQASIALAVTLLVGMAVQAMILNKLSFLNRMYFIVSLVLVFFGLILYFIRTRKKASMGVNNSVFHAFFFLWYLSIGFFPSLWISSNVFKFEREIWENTLLSPNINSAPEIQDTTHNYSNFRSSWFSGIIDSVDPQIGRFIFSVALHEDNSNNSQQAGHSPAWTFFILLLTLVSLGGMWWLIRRLVNQVYWLKFSLREENSLGKILKSEIGNCSNQRLFLCGCDSYVNRHWTYQNLELKPEEVLLIDCSETGLALPPLDKVNQKKAILIEDIHCLERMEGFLDQIPDLLKLAENKHLILSSGTNWMSLVGRLPLEQQRIRLSELMFGFYFEFVPLHSTTSLPEVKPKNVFDEVEIEDYFKAKGLLKKNAEDQNARILMMRYGKAYFYNIWAELSLEEKSVCFNYAKEGFFSFQNNSEVIELFQKGVIVLNEDGDNLQLFSKTFRYFILGTVSRDQINQILRYQKQFSTVGNTQWAILSFLVIAIGLVGYFERSFFTEVQAMVTGIAGIVSLLIREFRRFFVAKSVDE